MNCQSFTFAHSWHLNLRVEIKQLVNNVDSFLNKKMK